MVGIAVLTGESACPALVRKGLHLCGAGAFACQPIFSHLLTVAVLIGAGRQRLGGVLNLKSDPFPEGGEGRLDLIQARMVVEVE
jgi:hypothetical protein